MILTKLLGVRNLIMEDVSMYETVLDLENAVKKQLRRPKEVAIYLTGSFLYLDKASRPNAQDIDLVIVKSSGKIDTRKLKETLKNCKRKRDFEIFETDCQALSEQCGNSQLLASRLLCGDPKVTNFVFGFNNDHFLVNLDTLSQKHNKELIVLVIYTRLFGWKKNWYKESHEERKHKIRSLMKKACIVP